MKLKRNDDGTITLLIPVRDLLATNKGCNRELAERLKAVVLPCMMSKIVYEEVKEIWTPPPMLILDNGLVRPMGGKERAMCERLKLGSIHRHGVRWEILAAEVDWLQDSMHILISPVGEFTRTEINE